MGSEVLGQFAEGWNREVISISSLSICGKRKERITTSLHAWDPISANRLGERHRLLTGNIGLQGQGTKPERCHDTHQTDYSQN
jgi:hypothetical protein